LTNSIKHSSGYRTPHIEILLKKEGSRYSFSYHEKDGKKIDIKELENSKNLGMRLIRLTVEDIEGEIKVFWDDGLRVEIYFS
jgi:two-component sensor histidine kinase